MKFKQFFMDVTILWGPQVKITIGRWGRHDEIVNQQIIRRLCNLKCWLLFKRSNWHVPCFLEIPMSNVQTCQGERPRTLTLAEEGHLGKAVMLWKRRVLTKFEEQSKSRCHREGSVTYKFHPSCHQVGRKSLHWCLKALGLTVWISKVVLFSSPV